MKTIFFIMSLLVNHKQVSRYNVFTIKNRQLLNLLNSIVFD